VASGARKTKIETSRLLAKIIRDFEASGEATRHLNRSSEKEEDGITLFHLMKDLHVDKLAIASREDADYDMKNPKSCFGSSCLRSPDPLQERNAAVKNRYCK
jgi:hypothetical protein